MNCAELLYVVFSDATKLSSKTPNPKRLMANKMVIDTTNIINNVKNLSRMSVNE